MASFKKQNNIILLVKTTHRCNMNCSYCYDRVLRETVKDEMTLDMVKEICRKSERIADHITWIWHGGEFLVKGEEWVKEAVLLVKQELGKRLTNMGLQTNGVALTEDLMHFFKEQNVNVGISFDGIHHNETRGNNGELIASRIAKAIDIGVLIGPIMVLSKDTIADWKANIELIKSFGLKQCSFNWIHPDEVDSKSDYQGEKETFVSHLKDMYDYLLFDKDEFNDRGLAAIISNIFKSRDCVCTYSGCMGNFLAIGPQGNFYPCDRYYPEDYNMGNLSDVEYLHEAFFSRGYEKLVKDKAARLQKCIEKGCDLFEHCNGGCNANAILINGTAASFNENWCYIYKEIFWHVFDRIKDLSQEDMLALNPTYFKQLSELGYRSLSSIKEAMKEFKEGELQ